jgi:hypothetical protein
MTSRGRSLLGIAIENENLEIVRFLVVEKSMTLTEVKNLSLETTIKTLEASLHLLPTASDGTIQVPEPTGTRDFIPSAYGQPHDVTPVASPSLVTLSQWGASPSSPGEMFDGTAGYEGGRIDELSSGSVEDAVSSLMILDGSLIFYPRNSLLTPSLSFYAVHHLFCKHNRLCRDAMRSPDLLHAMQHQHFPMPSVFRQLLLYESLQAIATYRGTAYGF